MLDIFLMNLKNKNKILNVSEDPEGSNFKLNNFSMWDPVQFDVKNPLNKNQ